LVVPPVPASRKWRENSAEKKTATCHLRSAARAIFIDAAATAAPRSSRSELAMLLRMVGAAEGRPQ
jgi:hypothetical protein